MTKIIIGIDPDSKAHGVAEYWDGELVNLRLMPLMSLQDLLSDIRPREDLTVHMEDVCANNAIFRTGNNKKVQQSIARRLGMVQQSQVEVERLCESMGIKIVKHKISKAWKKDKRQFELVTKWEGRSNEDTRSAAYFGWLGANS